jgi:hypothetical protein
LRRSWNSTDEAPAKSDIIPLRHAPALSIYPGDSGFAVRHN